MTQHFLLSAGARSLSAAKIMHMSDSYQATLGTGPSAFSVQPGCANRR